MMQHSSLRHLLRQVLVYEMGGVVFLCIFLLSLISIANASSAYAVSVMQESQPTCPGAKPFDPNAPPSLEFCSPKFRGHVEGPFGSHIVLIGENFSSVPTVVFLVPKSQTVSEDLIRHCWLHSSRVCFALPSPSRSLDPKKFLYSFTWTFPVTSVPNDFFAVAVVGDTSHFHIVQSSAEATFTLLSLQPPCIAVSHGNSNGTQLVDCTQPQSIQLFSGSSITVRGSFWLPGEEQIIHVMATCGSSQQLFQFIVQPDQSGSFEQTKVLRQNAAGTCEITAYNTVVTSGSDTVADNALTFGGRDDTTKFTLIVRHPVPMPPPPCRPPCQPTPDFSMMDKWALLAMIPAVLALFVCLFLFSQRTQGVSVLRYIQQDNYLLTDIILRDIASFNAKGNGGDTKQLQIDAAAQVLAQGDPEMAIRQAILALETTNSNAWEELLQAIVKTPTNRMPPQVTIGQRAFQALQEAIRDGQHALEHCSRALVLYKWLLNAVEPDTLAAADIYYNMVVAYSNLQTTMLQTIFSHLLICYQTALEIYESQGERRALAATRHNMGNAYFSYSTLPAIDKETQRESIEAAISSYEEALQACTAQNFPEVWAATHYHLGLAYTARLVRNPILNLEDARRHFQAALTIYSLTRFPEKWAKIQINIGEAYYQLSDGGSLGNLHDAIAHFKNALQVYRPDRFPTDYAMTQYKLGLAYYLCYKIGQTGLIRATIEHFDLALKIYLKIYKEHGFVKELIDTQYRLGLSYVALADVDQRNSQRNLEKAICYYKDALQNCAGQPLPALWASIQSGLGDVYIKLSRGHKQDDLRNAIDCYREAWKVYGSDPQFALDCARVQDHMGDAYYSLYEVAPSKNRREYLDESQTSHQAALNLYIGHAPTDPHIRKIGEKIARTERAKQRR